MYNIVSSIFLVTQSYSKLFHPTVVSARIQQIEIK